MTHELLFNIGAAELRIANVREGKLVRFSTQALMESADDTLPPGLIGSIVLGRVEKIVPAMNAAFVEIGLERSGFLGAREASGTAMSNISDCVREGEVAIFQILREPAGEKGARLSKEISIPGRLCVLAPNRDGVTPSRRITDAAERARLTNLCEGLVPEGMGLILRTAAVGAAREELAAEITRQVRVWKEIQSSKARPPTVLFRELNSVLRTLRDAVTDDLSRIAFDDAECLAQARHYCRTVMPKFEERLALHAGAGGILDSVEDDIEALFRKRVDLPSGAWITIEPTEALTAIDVNSGRFTDSPDRQGSALAVNLEAAAEIARQIILRNLAGQIVIDFIQVSADVLQKRIVSQLHRELAEEGTPCQVAVLAETGLVAIIRKRTGSELSAGYQAPTVMRVAMAILRRAERESRANPGRAIIVRAAPAVADILQTRQNFYDARLARRGVPGLTLQSDPEFAIEVFDVRAV